jgi:hypothetical protein
MIKTVLFYSLDEDLQKVYKAMEFSLNLKGRESIDKTKDYLALSLGIKSILESSDTDVTNISIKDQEIPVPTQETLAAIDVMIEEYQNDIEWVTKK